MLHTHCRSNTHPLVREAMVEQRQRQDLGRLLVNTNQVALGRAVGLEPGNGGFALAAMFQDRRRSHRFCDHPKQRIGLAWMRSCDQSLDAWQTLGEPERRGNYSGTSNEWIRLTLGAPPFDGDAPLLTPPTPDRERLENRDRRR